MFQLNFKILNVENRDFCLCSTKQFFALFIFLCLSFTNLFAEQLAIKNFSITEGLARNQTSVIYSDSKGFVWIGTADGLSRFDGYTFTNYSTKNGLPNPVISGIAEAESGIYWVATQSGLCLIDFNLPLDENGKLQMQIIQLGNANNHTVFSIFLDDQKILWAGTRDGIYKITRENNQVSNKKIILTNNENARRDGTAKFIKDSNGNLWITNPNGLFRIDSAENITKYELTSDKYFDKLGNIAIDENGLLWISGLTGLYVLKPPVGAEKLQQLIAKNDEIQLPTQFGEFIIFDEKNGLLDKRALEIFHSSDKKIWIASRKGVSTFDGNKFQNYTVQNGLMSDEILCFGEDSTGNIWIGTESTGVMRVAQNGFITYTEADGLTDNRISSVFQGTDGEIYAVVGNRQISRFDNGKFTTVKPNFPKNITEFGWSWQRPVLQDSQRQWWIATAQGLVNFPQISKIEELANISALMVYDSTNGLAGNQIYRLFEDKSGNVWASNFAPPAAGIARWERSTGKIQKFTEDATGNRKNISAYSFVEDNNGNILFGLNNGGIARYRDNKIEIIANLNNLPLTNIYDMLVDQKGNIWLATGAGAYYLENLTSENPQITPLTTDQGLATNDIIAITDDQDGRIYFATSQGIIRYNPNSKRSELFTTADGIANSELRTAMRSEDGNLWFGTLRGLTRFEPNKLKEINQPAPILIRSVKVGGENFPISELGTQNVKDIEILPSQNHLEIEVLGLSLNSGDVLKYQYKLSNDKDWSEPTTQRKFTLVNLQPGNYQFEARVINASGLISKTTANVTFTALAPFYLRWWFILSIILLICLLAYLFYRNRVKRLLELEKVRHTIATDLHDDIGSSLSQISLISEVLALKGNEKNVQEKESLETIAKTSREAVGSMSEMVWAINPKRDNLIDTIQRMRRFVSDTLTIANIEFTFLTPDLDKNIKIDVDTRRHIYLLYKEAINNAIKHSEATKIDIKLSKSANKFILTISDNGKGFIENENQAGNGLNNMRLRTEKIGGFLNIDSKTGTGTTITLHFPYHSSIFNKITT